MHNNSNLQIKLGAVVSYLGIAVNIVMGLLYTPWMIKEIGQQDYALYTLATSVITMFTIDFGMSAAVSRYVAKYKAENQQTKINDFLGLIYKMYTIIAVIVFIILSVVFFNLSHIYSKLSPEDIGKLRVVFAIAGLYSVVSFPFVTFNGIISAYEKFVQLKMCELFNKVGVVILVVIALIRGQGLYALVMANAVIGLATILIKYRIIKKHTDINVNFSFFDLSYLKEIFGYSVWSTVGSIAQNFLITITPSIIAVAANSKEVAIFGFANSIGSYIYLLAMGVDGFFLPKVSRMVAGNAKPDDFVDLMIKVGRFQLSILGIVSIGFLVLGKQFISLLMGSEYASAFYCVIFYLIYSIVSYPQQIANTMVIALNKVKERAIISILAAVVNIAFSAVLAYCMGAIGACISLCLSIITRTVLLDVLYKRKMDLDIARYFRKCHLAFLIPFSAAGVLSYAAVQLIRLPGWSGFILKACAVSVIYVLVMLLIGLNKEEKEAVKKRYAKKQHRS